MKSLNFLTLCYQLFRESKLPNRSVCGIENILKETLIYLRPNYFFLYFRKQNMIFFLSYLIPDDIDISLSKLSIF